MKNKNNILNEEIKGKIMEILLKKDSSFSEILKKSNLSDHGQLNYHLKQMILQGIIEKKQDKYSNTLLGERMGVYLNQFQSKETYPLSVVCTIIKNEKDEILIIQRAKSPQKGKWGIPGGKMVIGEKIKETAERETFEETGLKLKFIKVLGFFPSLVYKEGELSYHANLIPVLMQNIKSSKKIKIDLNEISDYKFVNLKNINKYDLIANNKKLLKYLHKNKFIFNEMIHKE